MNLLRENKKLIIGIIIGIVLTTGIAVYAYNGIAGSIEYTKKDGTVTNVGDALTELYNISNNNNSGECQYTADELQEILNIAVKKVEVKDVLTNNFMTKLSTSKSAAKKLLDNNDFRNNVSASLLSYLKVALVSSVSNNTNVLYSSEYNSGWAAYMAFATSNTCWCTSQGDTTNAYIGYNFNNNVNVRIAKFYNSGTQTYPCKQAKLQYSDNNSDWNDASDVYTFENACKEVFLFNTKDDSSHKYWRIFILNSYRSDYIEINNLQFYGI